jgi:2'-5' RNA ligase
VTGLRRAFLAVVPSPSARAWAESAAKSAAAVAPELRWSAPTQLHLTVRFFGAVPDPVALAASLADPLRACAPFTLSLGGGGAFPSARRASVLWLGVRGGCGALTALAERLGPLDPPFRAHLTLARSRRRRDLRDVVAALDSCGESERWTVGEVVLFESDAGTHTEQARFTLAG